MGGAGEGTESCGAETLGIPKPLEPQTGFCQPLWLWALHGYATSVAPHRWRPHHGLSYGSLTRYALSPSGPAASFPVLWFYAALMVSRSFSSTQRCERGESPLGFSVRVGWYLGVCYGLAIDSEDARKHLSMGSSRFRSRISPGICLVGHMGGR